MSGFSESAALLESILNEINGRLKNSNPKPKEKGVVSRVDEDSPSEGSIGHENRFLMTEGEAQESHAIYGGGDDMAYTNEKPLEDGDAASKQGLGEGSLSETSNQKKEASDFQDPELQDQKLLN